jgi:pyruvate kinase
MMDMRKTKIICTLGPSSCDAELIKELIRKGMNAARFNFSHGTYQSHGQLLHALKEARNELKVPIAAILDTKGPEIRTKSFQNGSATVKTGDRFSLITGETAGDETKVATTYPELYRAVKPGNRILIDDGLIALMVAEIEGTEIKCIVLNGGVIGNNKGINIPNVIIDLPALTQKDQEDIKFAIQNDFDYIAASFIRKASDVLTIRQLLRENGGEDIGIISKIENRQGVENFDAIIEASDAIMVARGDLGVEIPVFEVPIIQKQIIKKCLRAGKPVITATQMLDSMIRNPRPTRAEASDVANAVFDGTSAIMLSGETASGKYPLESVATMADIAVTAEKEINYWQRFRKIGTIDEKTIAYAISRACCTTAMDLNAKTIITVTQSGHTARMISRFRPQCPIAAVTSSVKVQRKLSILWGISAEIADEVGSTDELFQIGIEKAVSMGLASPGDMVVISAGVPVGIKGTTNLVKAQIV